MVQAGESISRFIDQLFSMPWPANQTFPLPERFSVSMAVINAALLAFGGAAILWILTDLSAAYVAVAAAVFLVAVRAVEQRALIEGLGSKVVWLVIGTFVLGAAVEKSGLADRLTARCLLAPLTESEASTYVHGRLSASGAGEPLFSPDALSALHRAADGLPRRLNRLADLALLVAYADGLPRPDARAIAVAVREAAPDPLAA